MIHERFETIEPKVEKPEEIIENEASAFDEQVKELANITVDIAWHEKLRANHQSKYEKPTNQRETLSIKEKESEFESFKEKFLKEANETFPRKVGITDKITKGYSNEIADRVGENKQFDFLKILVSENIEHWRERTREKTLRENFKNREVNEIKKFLAEFDDSLSNAREIKHDIDRYNKDGRIILEEIRSLRNDAIKIYEEIGKEAVIKDQLYRQQKRYSHPQGIFKRLNEKIDENIEKNTKINQEITNGMGRRVEEGTKEYEGIKGYREQQHRTSMHALFDIKQHGRAKIEQKTA